MVASEFLSFSDEKQKRTVRLEEIESHFANRNWAGLARALNFPVESVPFCDQTLRSWGICRADEQFSADTSILSSFSGFRLLLVKGDVSYRRLRRAMLRLYRRYASDLIVWWWVDGDKINAMMVDRREEGGKPYVRRLETNLSHPDSTSLRQWQLMGLGNVCSRNHIDPVDALRRHFIDVLDHSELTEAFFSEFEKKLRLLKETMHHGPDRPDLRHEVALTTLLRMVFVCFLQESELLDGDLRFLLRRLTNALARGDNYYEHILKPLFFEVLNTPVARRSVRAERLGKIPFLNGGLFEPIPVEKQHPDLTWPNDVWRKVIEQLFECYHFTLSIGPSRDRCRAVDPEMLGKVFEGLMYGESRKNSGSFYTPRKLVREMVQNTVVRYFSTETDLEPKKIRSMLEGDCQRQVSESCRVVLREASILDPAVGTGAFLIEALKALERMYRAVGLDRQFETEFEFTKTLIHRHLRGVDIQKTAVRLCQLRLWLELLSTVPRGRGADHIPPLPNLSHRIRCGNSLRGHSPAGHAESAGLGFEPPAKKLERLHDRFVDAHGQKKAELRRKLEALEQEAVTKQLQKRVQLLETQLGELTRVADSEDLFGDEYGLSSRQKKQKRRLETQLEQIRERLKSIEAGRTQDSDFPFAFLESGGQPDFDMILTNPPWVRASRIDRSRRRQLSRRYRVYGDQLWPGASELGIRTPFGSQIDLAEVFVERCLRLLGERGHLTALVPSKLLRSLHGAPVRRILAEHDINWIKDYSESGRSFFDAATYPMIVSVRTSKTPRCSASRTDNTCRVELASSSETHSWVISQDALPLGSHPAEPWVTAPPAITRIFDEMMGRGRQLGSMGALNSKRGVMTGRNEVFVFDRDELEGFLNSDEIARWTRPVLKGRDLDEWHATSRQRLLWPYDESLELKSRLPRRLTQYFERHRESLEARADYSGNKPVWQMFRIKPGLVRPKVAWKDMSPYLEAAVVSDEQIPLNSVYFVPVSNETEANLLAGLLNSSPIRTLVRAIAERARGGWRRHFAWIIKMIPVPNPLVEVFEDPATDLSGPARTLATCARDARSKDGDPVQLNKAVAELFELDSQSLDLLKNWEVARGGRGPGRAA